MGFIFFNIYFNDVGFRKGSRETSDAIAILKIISKRRLDVKKDICACFIYWQKDFDNGNMSKFIELHKKIGGESRLEGPLVHMELIHETGGQGAIGPRGDQQA